MGKTANSTTPDGPGQVGTKCPFARVQALDDVMTLVRSRTAVDRSPELFAAIDADPINGEINLREFLSGSFTFVEGDSHRQRRKIMNRLVRPDALEEIREDIIVPEARRLMARLLAQPDADGVFRFDLVEYLERVFINFTARLIGLVEVESDERTRVLRSCAGPIAAGTSSGFLADRSAANERALAAKQRYVEEFFLPSLRWHQDMRARVDAGEVSDDAIPSSFLKFVAAHAHPNWEDVAGVIVESTNLFAASVGTSTQSVVHTVDFLQEWFRTHPEDYEDRSDVTFLLNALQETIRLRAPFSPYTTRLALEDHVLSDGTQVCAGQELHIEWVAANRDQKVFGEDANEFNPRRPSPSNGVQRFGVGFGVGAHQCLGMRVVVGNDGLGGSHVKVLQGLVAAGVRPDPDNPPVELKKNMDKFSLVDIPRYISYPAVFPEWQGSPGG
jgi:cytochrome P450